MQYSKHNFKHIVLGQRRNYDQNYQVFRTSYSDKNVRITINRCDLCSDQLPQTEGVNLETRMKIIDEIDDSFESEYDKSTYEQGSKLLLCERLSFTSL